MNWQKLPRKTCYKKHRVFKQRLETGILISCLVAIGRYTGVLRSLLRDVHDAIFGMKKSGMIEMRFPMILKLAQ